MRRKINRLEYHAKEYQQSNKYTIELYRDRQSQIEALIFGKSIGLDDRMLAFKRMFESINITPLDMVSTLAFSITT